MRLKNYKAGLKKRLRDPGYAAEYLAQVLAEKDSAAFLIALKDAKKSPLVIPHHSFDFRPNPLHKQSVKAANKTEARKTPGTLAVEKHRPLMNKLTAAQRQRLRQRAAALLYGNEALASGR